MKYIKLWGYPQGNELIWGRLILRQIDTYKFKKIAYFDSYTEANTAFNDWIDEYSEYEYCDGEKK